MLDELMNENNTVEHTRVEQNDQPQQEPIRDNMSQLEPQHTRVEQDSLKERNLRYLRERAEAAERRAAELEYQMKLREQQSKPQVQIDDDEMNIEDDSYIEGRQLKKYVNKLKQQVSQTNKQFEEYTKQQDSKIAVNSLKSQYQDFDSVVNEDNLNKFAQEEPEIYRSILSNPDVFDRGKAAYNMIKKTFRSEQRVEPIQQSGKPRSAASAGPQTAQTPLSTIGDYDRRILSDADRDRILRAAKAAQQYR